MLACLLSSALLAYLLDFLLVVFLFDWLFSRDSVFFVCLSIVLAY